MKGFASFVSEMWILFFRIGSCSACYVYRVNRCTCECIRVWLAATHYFESEITSWLCTSKYILLVTTSSDQIENIGQNTFIKCPFNSSYCLGNKARIPCRRYIYQQETTNRAHHKPHTSTYNQRFNGEPCVNPI